MAQRRYNTAVDYQAPSNTTLDLMRNIPVVRPNAGQAISQALLGVGELLEDRDKRLVSAEKERRAGDLFEEQMKLNKLKVEEAEAKKQARLDKEAYDKAYGKFSGTLATPFGERGVEPYMPANVKDIIDRADPKAKDFGLTSDEKAIYDQWFDQASKFGDESLYSKLTSPEVVKQAASVLPANTYASQQLQAIDTASEIARNKEIERLYGQLGKGTQGSGKQPKRYTISDRSKLFKEYGFVNKDGKLTPQGKDLATLLDSAQASNPNAIVTQGDLESFMTSVKTSKPGLLDFSDPKVTANVSRLYSNREEASSSSDDAILSRIAELEGIGTGDVARRAQLLQGLRDLGRSPEVPISNKPPKPSSESPTPKQVDKTVVENTTKDYNAFEEGLKVLGIEIPSLSSLGVDKKSVRAKTLDKTLKSKGLAPSQLSTIERAGLLDRLSKADTSKKRLELLNIAKGKLEREALRNTFSR